MGTEMFLPRHTNMVAMGQLLVGQFLPEFNCWSLQRPRGKQFRGYKSTCVTVACNSTIYCVGKNSSRIQGVIKCALSVWHLWGQIGTTVTKIWKIRTSESKQFFRPVWRIKVKLNTMMKQKAKNGVFWPLPILQRQVIPAMLHCLHVDVHG